jgi:hypothetical protein
MTDLVEVFTLNMTYDVPVKLFSFHLILMTLVLLAPECRRITSFVFQRAAAASESLELFASSGANRIALVAQVVFGLTMLAAHGYGSWQGWHSFGGGAPKSALFGIWNVDPADNSLWRRVVFETFPTMALQNADNTFERYSATVDMQKNTIALSNGTTKTLLTFQRPSPKELVLDGTLAYVPVHLHLKLVDRNSFLLVNRGFHWIQEFPFNR